jgi:protein-tyrosine-phosphatase
LGVYEIALRYRRGWFSSSWSIFCFSHIVVQVMREKGIDVSANKPKLITNQMVQEADVIIVMGCSAQGFCPAPLLNKVTDWGIEDPKGKPVKKVREIRDEIEKRVRTLLDEAAQ